MTTIYTFGYLGRTPEELARAAHEHDAVVVDTRYNPTSRLAVWRQGALTRLLGADYLVVRDLGNVNYRVGTPIVIAAPEQGLPIVEALLADQPVILLCACRDGATCHRTVVAQMLAERTGAPIVHL